MKSYYSDLEASLPKESPLRPISADAFLQRSPEKLAEEHAKKETHQSKSVRYIEKFAGRIVEVISTFHREHKPMEFCSCSKQSLSMAFVAKDLDIVEDQSTYLGLGEER